jgi:hypothetical protein
MKISQTAPTPLDATCAIAPPLTAGKTPPRPLLAAAIAGLLCLSTACSASDTPTPSGGGDAASDTHASPDSIADGADALADGADAPADAAEVASETSTDAVADASPDVLDASDASDAAAESASDAAGDVTLGCPSETGGVITSSTVDATMDLAKFTALCDARHGTVEIHPHCGGYNSCKGLSYDTSTHVLTEHTCKGLNTCAGYSCIDPC